MGTEGTWETRLSSGDPNCRCLFSDSQHSNTPIHLYISSSIHISIKIIFTSVDFFSKVNNSESGLIPFDGDFYLCGYLLFSTRFFVNSV